MKIKYVSIALCGLLMVACTDGGIDEIRAWMTQEESGMRGRVKPVPEIKPYTPVSYEVASIVEPFSEARLAQQKKTKTGDDSLKPEDRQPEPLEAFPISSLSMVGMLQQGKIVHALIRAGSNIYQVKVGNYMGQDHGLVTEIDETQVTLRELVENSEGEWSTRVANLPLQER